MPAGESLGRAQPPYLVNGRKPLGSMLLNGLICLRPRPSFLFDINIPLLEKGLELALVHGSIEDFLVTTTRVSVAQGRYVLARTFERPCRLIRLAPNVEQRQQDGAFMNANKT